MDDEDIIVTDVEDEPGPENDQDITVPPPHVTEIASE
jgi:hypothetical protein